MNKKTLGKQIRKHRLKRGLTSEQLAEAVNLSAESIRHYECGYKAPGVETLIRIANALNVSMDELLYDKLNATKPVVLQGIAQKLEPLSPEQLRAVSQVLDALSDFYAEQ